MTQSTLRIPMETMTGAEACRTIITFGDLEVDPGAHRVTREGKPVLLEPKAYAVLLEFLAYPGEMLGRDRLLDTVWGHRHVTPAVLSRVIAQLRRVFGDDAAEPRFIETVHGIGYRFVAQVSHRSTSTAMPSFPEPIRSAHVDDAAFDVKDDVAAAVATRPVTFLDSGLAAPPATRIVRPGRPGISFAIAAIALAVVMAWLGVRSVVPEPPAVAIRLAVLPFSARGDQADLSAAGEGLSESLADAFARLPAFRVAGRESVLALARGTASPQKIAAQLGVDYALAGELVTTDAGLDLRLGLWKRGEAAPVWLETHSAPRAQLFRVLAPITDHVRVTLAPASIAPSAASDTSVTAQDLYWLGRHYTYQRTSESLARALGYFQRSIAEDPRFAPAYCGVADSTMLLFEYGDLSLDEAAAKSRAAISQAKALDPHLPDADASEGLVLLDEGRSREAVDVLSRAAANAPNHATIALWYGTALAYAGRPREALDVHRQAAALDPLNAVVETYIGQDYSLMGDQAQATAHLEHALALNADYAEPYWVLSNQHALHGRLGEASNVLANARPRQTDGAWNAFQLAYLDVIAGDGPAAELALESASGISPLDLLDVRARARTLNGQTEHILGALDRITSGSSTAARHAALRARSLIAVGRTNEARTIYDGLFANSGLAGDPFLKLWTPDFGFGHYANWLALLPVDSATRRLGTSGYREQIARLRSGGVNVPLIAYQEAVVAALDDDTTRAERLLRVAMDQGWIDAGAFDRDFVWRRYRDAMWLQALRTRGAELAAKERETLRASASAQVR